MGRKGKSGKNSFKKLHSEGIHKKDKIILNNATYESWSEIDTIVLQWIYGALSDNLLVRILEPDTTTYESWKKLSSIFLNNKGSHATALEHEFNNLKLSTMSSLEDYCQCLRIWPRNSTMLKVW
uniref:Retrotransposon Copia-like N-terminal domain-containing protein n=1 Tax=Lactuca sativa TaxID=4236 RepID=A0A9R1WLW0_LACSA|nr:hypothetical protein LSAT_V11C100013850 [Lactuca sativa]